MALRSPEQSKEEEVLMIESSKSSAESKKPIQVISEFVAEEFESRT